MIISWADFGPSYAWFDDYVIFTTSFEGMKEEVDLLIKGELKEAELLKQKKCDAVFGVYKQHHNPYFNMKTFFGNWIGARPAGSCQWTRLTAATIGRVMPRTLHT